MAMLATTKMRIARPTDNLDAVTRFYRDGKTFEDPDGYRVVLQHSTWDGRNRCAIEI